MSRPKYWWYSNVKRAIMNADRYKNSEVPEQLHYILAIEKAKGDVAEMEDGAYRLKAIDDVLIKHYKTIDGAAFELHYSRRTIQRWLNDFIYKVGKYKGFC